MNQKPPAPVARLTMITLGVSDMRTSIAFYEALGFERKFRATGEAVAFFETGGTAIGLFPWHQLAQDVTLPENPRPQAFRGMTLAWNCRTTDEVDAVLDFAISKGVIPGKSWSHRASRWVRTGAFICRIKPHD